MADKKIEIQISTKADPKGAQDAQRALRGVETAAQDLSHEADAAAGGSLDDLQDRLREMRERAEDAQDAADDLAASTAHGESRAGVYARRLGMAGVAGAALMAGRHLRAVWEELDKVNTADLSKIDAEMAGQIETLRTYANAAKDPIGALVAWVKGESVAAAFGTMNDGIEAALKTREGMIDRIIEKGVMQTAELKKLAEDLKAANAILDARDAADSAARDRRDAAEIRGGAAPEDVEARRVREDRATAIDKLGRDLDAERVQVVAAANNSVRAQMNLSEVEGTDGAKREDVEKAKQAAAEAEAAYQEARQRFQTAQEIASERAREIRETASGRLEGLQEDKSGRLQREREAEEKRQAAEAEKERRKQEAEEKRREKESQRAGRQQTSESRGIGREARGLVRSGVNPALAEKINAAATALDDGATGDELSALMKPLEHLAQAVQGRNNAMEVKLGQITKRIEQLSKQISNGRSTR